MPDHEKGNVLVVDNHPVILRYVADLLEKHGYVVRTAADGVTALDILKDYAPDHFILDLVMPNIDGAALCRIVRETDRFRRTPVIVLSGIAAEESCRLKTLGANMCIAKGPLPEMGENILLALEKADPLCAPDEEIPVLGLENIYPRGITEELLTINAHLNIMLESISDGLIEVNRDGKVIFVNAAAAELFGKTRESLLGGLFVELFDNENQTIVAPFLDSASITTQSGHLTQRSRHLNVKAVPVGPQGRNRIVILNDVTEYEQTRKALLGANRDLKVLARTDGLTHIANRRWFDDRLLREWKRMRREKGELSLLLCDVDHLKEINDRYGHMVGDDCLRYVARLIAAQTKRPADLAARYGGDEFALILPNTSQAGAEHMAGELLSQTLEMTLNGTEPPTDLAVSLSIGISSCRPCGDCSSENLLSLADDALYEAKKRGRNRIVSRRIETCSA